MKREVAASSLKVYQLLLRYQSLVENYNH